MPGTPFVGVTVEVQCGACGRAHVFVANSDNSAVELQMEATEWGESGIYARVVAVYTCCRCGFVNRQVILRN
jgi:hypothetical protein